MPKTKNLILAVFLSVFAFVATAADTILRPDHPDEYIVREGDTLWGIASMFLQDAWLWPEIWYVNPEIENPHLIYPGDTVYLTMIDGKPRLTVERGAPSRTTKLTPEFDRNLKV